MEKLYDGYMRDLYLDAEFILESEDKNWFKIHKLDRLNMIRDKVEELLNQEV